jgi:hypothetical protein
MDTSTPQHPASRIPYNQLTTTRLNEQRTDFINDTTIGGIYLHARTIPNQDYEEGRWIPFSKRPGEPRKPAPKFGYRNNNNPPPQRHKHRRVREDGEANDGKIRPER